MPSSKYARFFIAACDRPIAGPSANSSGKPSPTSAMHVYDDLNGKIDYILDGGNCDVGVESTVVDGLHDPPLILRPGGVSLEELRSLGGKWSETQIGYKLHHSPSAPSTPESEQYIEDTNGAPRAPGMKYKHYSPTACVILFSKSARQRGAVENYLASLATASCSGEQLVRVGMLSWTVPYFFGIPLSGPGAPSSVEEKIMQESHYKHCLSTASFPLPGATSANKEILLFNVAIHSKITDLARELFGILRLFDDLKCDYIMAPVVERNTSNGGKKDVNGAGSGELWDAVADRIGKASSERID